MRHGLYIRYGQYAPVQVHVGWETSKDKTDFYHNLKSTIRHADADGVNVRKQGIKGHRLANLDGNWHHLN